MLVNELSVDEFDAFKYWGLLARKRKRRKRKTRRYIIGGANSATSAA
jgi:hypothetical protein